MQESNLFIKDHKLKGSSRVPKLPKSSKKQKKEEENDEN
jgi:hypothetical protein